MKQAARHTPAPWIVKGENNGKDDVTVYALTEKHRNPQYIARVYGAGICSSAGGINAELAANTVLIASAPALYDALRNLLNNVDAGRVTLTYHEEGRKDAQANIDTLRALLLSI